jgi:large subunit ribosomal protein L19
MAPIPVLANPGADTIDWMLTMNLIQTLEQEEIARLNKTIPKFARGYTFMVRVKVVYGSRMRVQA